uniref:Uncharacterized LOC101243296 n=1 Tax=Ciona intestinalis TaxID=7719 RepID=H2XS24_CIOIN|nr:uncharacterized protein LOC101243296 isoform X1 [Ciona intestinalis]|eukprot:XP_004226741.1 uncharacterized protein LOC101243296 isoform X1 [Ciona intestinalis]
MFKFVCLLGILLLTEMRLSEGASPAHRRDIRFLSGLRRRLLTSNIIQSTTSIHVILHHRDAVRYFRIRFPVNCTGQCAYDIYTRRMKSCGKKTRPFGCLFCRVVMKCSNQVSWASAL